MRRSWWLFCFFLFLLGLVFYSASAKNEGQAKGSTYVGQDSCIGCHEDRANSLKGTVHAKSNVPGSPATDKGCESCHGPGSDHVASGGGKGVGGLVAFTSKKLSAGEKSKFCLNCHGSDFKLSFWKQGEHARSDVACSDCHKVHTAGKSSNVKEPDTCLSCHKEIRRDLNKYSRHPILEGKVNCSDCHDPHGTLSHGMIKAENNNQLCYKCHADKRGPFLWEHPPVEENCTICHNPHGAKASKLLKEKMPNICQDCHDWQRHPGTIYDANSGFKGSSPSNRFFARSCTNCHYNIHGSNAPHNPASGYNSGKAFVR